MADDDDDLGAVEKYILAYFATCNVLIDAIETFKQKVFSGAASIGEQAHAAAAALELQRKLSLVEMQHEVFMSQKGPINPPSDEMVEKSVSLARAMAKNLWLNKTVENTLKAVNDVATALAKYQHAENMIEEA